MRESFVSPAPGSSRTTTLAAVFVLALCTMLLVGCAGNQRNDLAASSLITFSAPGFYLASGSTFRWRSDLVYLFDDVRERPENVKPFLQQEIQGYLESRNCEFPAEATSAKYGLLAVVVLGDGLTATEVLKQFKLTPSFKASRKYEKGTVVVAIYDASDDVVLWRGAIQANVDLEMPPEQRRLLVRNNVRKLLDSIPGSSSY